MKIRAGYEISYDCPQLTPMILMLSIHPSRFPDLRTPDHIRFDPPISANAYHDGFDNFCHVIRAPAGRLTMSANFLIQDKGKRDRSPIEYGMVPFWPGYYRSRDGEAQCYLAGAPAGGASPSRGLPAGSPK